MVTVSWVVIGLLIVLICFLMIVMTWAALDATRTATKLSIAVEALAEIRRRCNEGEYTAAYDFGNDVKAEVDFAFDQLGQQE